MSSASSFDTAATKTEWNAHLGKLACPRSKQKLNDGSVVPLSGLTQCRTIRMLIVCVHLRPRSKQKLNDGSVAPPRGQHQRRATPISPRVCVHLRPCSKQSLDRSRVTLLSGPQQRRFAALVLRIRPRGKQAFNRICVARLNGLQQRHAVQGLHIHLRSRGSESSDYRTVALLSGQH